MNDYFVVAGISGVCELRVFGLHDDTSPKMSIVNVCLICGATLAEHEYNVEDKRQITHDVLHFDGAADGQAVLDHLDALHPNV